MPVGYPSQGDEPIPDIAAPDYVVRVRVWYTRNASALCSVTGLDERH